MALYTDQSFPSIAPLGTIPVPIPRIGGNVAPPTVHPNDPVVLQLNDTTRVTVFTSLTNALRCMEQMRQREQWLLQASDDIFIVSCGAKMIVCESTLINQKLFASFMPIYVRKSNSLRPSQHELPDAARRCAPERRLLSPGTDNPEQLRPHQHARSS